MSEARDPKSSPSEKAETPSAAADVARQQRMHRDVLKVGGAAALPLLTFGLYQVATWPDVASLAERPPETTAFIEAHLGARRAAGEEARLEWTWVPADGISVHLKRAVVAAEDMEFFWHGGFSRAEVWAAIRESITTGRGLRGASTLTQQLAKNLWLSPSRNPWRKIKEAILTFQLEQRLEKSRILEIYLNVVEFGPGVYGAEAAARRYFGKAASELTIHEAAMLAAGLPRPSRWHPGSSSSSYARYVVEIERRMAEAEYLWRYVSGPVPGAP